MNNTAIRISDRIIAWGVPVLGLAIPLAVFPAYIFLQIKSTILQCGAAVLFTAWAVKAIELRSSGAGKGIGFFVAPAFAFMLSAIFNVIFVTSSFDTSFDELAVRVPYFLLFLVTLLSFSDLARARRLLVWIMGAGFIVSVYGMMQHFRIDPLGIGGFDRIQSTFGNANFYVGFLIPVIPAVAAGFDFSDPGERKKTLSMIILILIAAAGYFIGTIAVASLMLRAMIFGALFSAVIAMAVRLRLREKTATAVTLFLLVNNLFLTVSRSGQIGLGAATIVFVVVAVLFISHGAPRRKILLISASTLILAGLVVGGVLYIGSSDQGRTVTISERKYCAKGAWELIKQKPILGHGIGTFKNNYPLVKTKESWAYNAMCFEHVSNVYNEHLEVLHDEGIVGFSVYLWLCAVMVIVPIIAMRRMSKTPLIQSVAKERFWMRTYAANPVVMVVGLLSGVIALLVSNIFSLSMRYTATGFIFWVFLGLLGAQVNAMLHPEATGTRRNDSNGNGPVHAVRSLWFRRIFEGAVGAAAIGILFFSVRIFIADNCMNEAVIHSKNAYQAIENTDRIYHAIFVEGTRYRSDPAEWELAIKNYICTIRCNPFSMRARYFLGNAFNRRWNMEPVCNQAWGDAPEQRRTDAHRALEQYDYVYKQAPHFTEIDYELGDLYMKLGDADQAIRYYKEYIKYMPFFTKVHYSLAEAYAAKKDWINAAEAYKDAIDLNQKFTLAYCNLSAVYHKMGKEDLRTEMLEKAREAGPHAADLLMVDVWEKLDEPELAVASCLTCIARDSADAGVYTKLGWLYIKSKQWEKAIAAYRKLLELNPSDALAYINLSNLFYETGRLQESKEAYLKALKIDPNTVRSMMNRQPTNE